MTNSIFFRHKTRGSRGLGIVLTAWLTLLVLLCPGMTAVAAGEMAAPGTAMADDEKVVLIVEVEGEPLLATAEAARWGAADYPLTRQARTRLDDIAYTQAAAWAEIKARAADASPVLYTYTHLFNGFALEASEQDIPAIKALPQVKNVYISEKIELEDPISEPVGSLPQPYLYNSGAMIKNDIVAARDYDGAGQVVAIIDSEFDVNHEFFRLSDSNTIKPKYTKKDIADILTDSSYEFNVDVSANMVYRSAKVPFAYDYVRETADVWNLDTVHGTHVAGIAAGKGAEFSGVAPEAQLVLMKVFDGETTQQAVVCAAIDDAAKLGVCAINLSLGASYVSKYLTSVYNDFMDNAQNAGIIIASSAGNAYRGYEENAVPVTDLDYSAAGLPALAASATAVASVDNCIWLSNWMVLESGDEVLFQEGKGATTFAASFADNYYDYVYMDYGEADDYAALGAAEAVAGKIVLVKYGSRDGSPHTSADKFREAEKAGASGLIFWNKAETLVSIYPSTIPGCTVTRSGGQALYDQTIRSLKTAPGLQFFPNASGTTLSEFSSWGTDVDLDLKPEISAPGGVIYSSLPDNAYAAKSGTSMAAPQITGAVALLNQYVDRYHSELSGKERARFIENLMMSTARIVYRDPDDPRPTPHSVRQQGAGLLDLERAMNTPAVFIGSNGKSKLNLGDGLSDELTLKFAVQNASSAAITYDEVEVMVFTDDYYEAEGEKYVGAMRRLNSSLPNDLPPIEVAPNATQAVLLTVKLDEAELEENAAVFTNGFYLDGYVVLKDSNEKLPAINMPFLGFYGDWNAQRVWDDGYYEGTSKYDQTYLAQLIGEQERLAAGENKYLDDDGAAIRDRKYIAYSPNGDRRADNLYLYGINQRSANIDIDLYNAAGTRVYDGSERGSIKFKPFAPGVSLAGYEEGAYTMRAAARYLGAAAGAEPEMLELPFVIDRQAPVIEQAELTADTLTVRVTDNHYLQYVEVTGQQQGQEVTEYKLPAADAASGATHTLTFDLAGFDEATPLTILAADYAQNITRLSSHAAAQLTGAGALVGADGALQTSAIVYNAGAAELTAELLCAVYDRRGKLIGLQTQSVARLGSQREQRCYFTIPGMAEAAVCKLMLLNDRRQMQPLTPAVSVELP